VEEIKRMTILLTILKKFKRDHQKNDVIGRCMDDCYYKVLEARDRLYCSRKSLLHRGQKYTP